MRAPQPGRVTIDTADGLIAVETHALTGEVAYSVLITAEQWIALVALAEDFPSVRQLRHELRGAKEAHSHMTRGAA